MYGAVEGDRALLAPLFVVDPELASRLMDDHVVQGQAYHLADPQAAL